MDEHARHAGVGEQVDRPIDRPALADRPRIDLDARPREPHPAAGRVELDLPHARRSAGCGQIVRGRRPSLPAQESPRPHEGARGDVEPAAGPVVKLAGEEEEPVHRLRHRLPPRSGAGIDPGNLARLPVDADHGLDLVHEVEGRAAQFRGVGHLADIEDDLESAGHRLPADDQRVNVGVFVHVITIPVASADRKASATEAEGSA
jgi:hypothetical protein